MSARAQHTRAIARALAAPLLFAILACVDATQPSAASVYASDATAPSYTACDATDVASLIAGLASTGRTSAYPSAETDRLALDVARILAAGRCVALTGATEARLGYRAGLYDHHLEIASERWTGRVDEAEVATFARELGVRPAESDLACPVAVGAARVTSGEQTLVVLVTAARCATFGAPMPRVLRTGEMLSLRGVVVLGEHPQSIQLTTPDGRVESSTLTPLTSTSFAWQRALGTPGRYVLELVGVSERTGPTPLVKAELLVGIDAPPIDEACRAATPQPIADAARETLAMLNTARSSLGLAPLVLEPHLTMAAQQHSDDMVQLHYFAHWSPSGSTPASRARAAGAPVSSTAENIASGLDASEMHEDLMESPGHRRSILDPTFTHVGIGISADEGELMLTELFGSVAPPLDVARDRPALLAAIGTVIGHAPAVDTRLEAAAQAAAERFFTAAAPSDLAVRRDALSRMTGVSVVRAECVSSRFVSLASPPRFDALAGSFDHFGVGLAQGHRSDGPPGEYIAVVLAAQLHAEATDTAELERRVLDLVNHRRMALGVPALESVDTLVALSRSLATRWLTGEATATLYDAAAAQRGSLGLRQEGLGYQCGGITTAEDALTWTVPLDPTVQRVGIGIVQGDHAGVSGALGMFIVGIRP